MESATCPQQFFTQPPATTISPLQVDFPSDKIPSDFVFNDGSFELESLLANPPALLDPGLSLFASPSDFDASILDPTELLNVSAASTEPSRHTPSTESTSIGCPSSGRTTSASVRDASPIAPIEPRISKKRPRARQSCAARRLQKNLRKAVDTNNTSKDTKRHSSSSKPGQLPKLGTNSGKIASSPKIDQNIHGKPNLNNAASQNKQVRKVPIVDGCTKARPSSQPARYAEKSSSMHSYGTNKPSNTDHQLKSRPGAREQIGKRNIEMKQTSLKSHTRKCREKVSRQLENLVRVLPQPGRRGVIKHKGQILDYTIQTLQSLLRKHAEFQAGIALSSVATLHLWVDHTIATVATIMLAEMGKKNPASKNVAPPTRNSLQVPLSTVLDPFIRLHCVNSQWPYGELWTVDVKSKRAYLSACVVNTDDEHVEEQLKAFEIASRTSATVSPTLGPGALLRTALSCSEEWIDEHGIKNGQFERGDLKKTYGIKTVQMMPVSFVSPRRCVAILVFADVRNRPFSVANSDKLRHHVTVITQRYIQYLHNMETARSQGAIPTALGDLGMPNALSFPGLQSGNNPLL